MNQRNIIIDITKAFLIILVVIGHCIQFGSGSIYLSNKMFFDNPLFKFIYSFHMPAFMLISGYLFALNKKNDVIYVIKRKIKHLLIPIFAWSILDTIYYILHNGFGLWSIKIYLSQCIHALWFLWALFYCSTIFILVKRFLRDNIYIHILFIIISFAIPDNLNLNLYKFVYPFFLLGYYSHNIKDKIKTYLNHKFILLTSTILFILLLLLYNYDSYIYTTGHTITSYYMLYIDIYRYTIGIIGSCCMFMWIYHFREILKFLPSLSYIGKKTMGIYIISGFLCYYILPRLAYKTNIHSFNLAILAIESASIIIASLITVHFIERFPSLKKYLLGYS